MYAITASAAPIGGRMTPPAVTAACGIEYRDQTARRRGQWSGLWSTLQALKPLSGIKPARKNSDHSQPVAQPGRYAAPQLPVYGEGNSQICLTNRPMRSPPGKRSQVQDNSTNDKRARWR